MIDKRSAGLMIEELGNHFANYEKLLETCQFAWDTLSDLTTDEFSKGGDKELRDRLSQAIFDCTGERPA